MNYIERMLFFLEWLRRIGRRKGFGIQSPSAYQYVTDVLCQRLPYHLYADLQELFPKVKSRQRKVYRLFFRLANDRQAEKTFVSPLLSDGGREYILAGNRRTTISKQMKGCGFIVVSATEMDIHNWNFILMDEVENDAVLAVTDIRRGKDAWQAVKTCERVKMTFDCYDVGVALFGHTLHQQHYSLNL